MKKILLSLLILNSSLCFATTNSQFETLEDYLNAPLSSIDNETKILESQLIENLLSGLDFSITNAVIASPNRTNMDSSYYISLQLVVLNPNGETLRIELFKSDEFAGTSGYAELNKEFFINGSGIFKTLDPYLGLIETAQKLNLAVSLVKSYSGVKKPVRNLGQTDSESNMPNIIYTFNLDSNLNSSGFKQDLNLPDAFSYEENTDISDVGFSLYYR